MNIEKYIKTLLLEKECVVIPGFGAFITNYVPAELNTNATLIQPPKKQLSFNASLVLNDGLLAAHVAHHEQISTVKALSAIKERVANYKQLLNKYSKFKIEGIGLLYKHDGSVLFEPDASTLLLLSSFGLTSAIVPKPIHEIAPVAVKRSWYWAAAIAVPLLGIGLWYANTQSSAFTGNLSPFHNQTEKYQPRTHEPAVNEFTAEEELLKAGVLSAIKLDETAKNAIKINAVNNGVAHTYHIIGGCFKELQNAQTLVNQLHDKGFGKATIIDIHKGLHRVAIASYSKNEDAREALSKVKAYENAEAWLLKK